MFSADCGQVSPGPPWLQHALLLTMGIIGGCPWETQAWARTAALAVPCQVWTGSPEAKGIGRRNEGLGCDGWSPRPLWEAGFFLVGPWSLHLCKKGFSPLGLGASVGGENAGLKQEKGGGTGQISSSSRVTTGTRHSVRCPGATSARGAPDVTWMALLAPQIIVVISMVKLGCQVWCGLLKVSTACHPKGWETARWAGRQ